MTLKARITIAALVFAVLFSGVALLFLRRSAPQPAPSIALPDGSTISIAAVSYGTNHVVGGTAIRLAARLPGPLRTFVQTRFRKWLTPRFQRTSNEPKLLIWMDLTNAPPGSPGGGYYNAVLANGTGFLSGAVEDLSTFSPTPLLEFKVFPRRDPTIAMHVLHHDSNGNITVCGTLTFPNPQQGRYPQWQPEPLPAVKRAGDVEVTLKSFVTGHDNNTRHVGLGSRNKKIIRGTDRKDGRNYTYCDVVLRSLSNTNQVWKVTGEEVSDATGNASRNNSMSWSGDDATFGFMPSLWPDENAWRIKLEIKREKGFTDSEQFTFRNVPLGATNVTNTVSWTSNHSGVRLTLAYLIRRAPNTNNSWSSLDLSNVQFTHSPLPEGTHIDLVTARTDTGTVLNTGSWSSSSGERSYSFKAIPLDAKTADFTFVVHQSRTVAFTVKPEVAAPEEKPAPRR